MHYIRPIYIDLPGLVIGDCCATFRLSKPTGVKTNDLKSNLLQFMRMKIEKKNIKKIYYLSRGVGWGKEGR